jgi:hypothetical protein
MLRVKARSVMIQFDIPVRIDRSAFSIARFSVSRSSFSRQHLPPPGASRALGQIVASGGSQLRQG